jgi:DeoR/GlpR family transcriptional regulator of sugar metabolism
MVDEHNYLSVKQLSELCHSSKITIRRDLEKLDSLKRLRRTHGGASSLSTLFKKYGNTEVVDAGRSDEPLFNRLDVLVTADILPKFASLIQKNKRKKKIPIIAESMPLPDTDSCVTVDNYQAGYDLGQWAGKYAGDHWNGLAQVLDLTYHRPNARARSQGFLAGLHDELPSAKLALSINAQSRYDMAYQLTRDAFTVYPEINIIFAINDISALGALNACKDLALDVNQIIILPFGIEGQTMIESLLEDKYIAAAVCMFPEIVATVCVEAAIAAYNHKPLPPLLNTPYCIVSRETLPDFYIKTSEGWQLQWQKIPCNINLPLPNLPDQPNKNRPLPKRLGFIYTFVDHEWYKTISRTMQKYTADLGIALEVVDFEQTLKDEVHMRQNEITLRAAEEIREGDTILIDAGPISCQLAEQLVPKKNITVITNSMAVLEVLKDSSPEITLICTGGALRRSSQLFIGPTAESTLKEFRIDKLFLMVTGISKNYGLYHTNISEVTIKQLMIRAAREVILLADYSCFQEEALIQVAPISVVHKLITDDALPASTRLELNALGVTVILAGM